MGLHDLTLESVKVVDAVFAAYAVLLENFPYDGFPVAAMYVRGLERAVFLTAALAYASLPVFIGSC